MLTPSSELLIRNIDLFEDSRWGVINPTDTHIFDYLSNDKVFGYHQYFDQYEPVEEQSRQVFGAAFTAPEGGLLDGVVIYLPKSKPHLLMLLENARSLVKDNGTIAVVGSNDAGIKSIGKLLTKLFGPSQKRDSARHCALWCTSNNAAQVPFSIDDYITTTEYSVANINWIVASLPGVFSHNSLDAGTQLLLDNLPQINGSNVLDFACGAGVIGSFIAARQPDLTVTFSDINALALHACEKTIELNNVNGRVIASNGLSAISQSYDHIVTNPPFHTGVSTDYSITENFIKAAPKALRSGGSLFLVANRFLPYPELIDRHFARHADVARSSKFTVYSASKK